MPALLSIQLGALEYGVRRCERCFGTIKRPYHLGRGTPHWHPQDILPVGRHLTSMQNFAGMLEYLCSWVWRAEGVLESSSGCLVSTGSLPFLIDNLGQPQSLGEYVAGRSVFATEADAYKFILEIAARDLQYRGFRDDRVANFRHGSSSC